MRQMHNNFRQSIAVQHAFHEAKNQPTIVRSILAEPESETPIVEPIIEAQPESIIVEEVKPVEEQPKKIEQPKTKLPKI